MSKTNLWQERFRVPFVPFLHLAKANPARGLVVSNQDNRYYQVSHLPRFGCTSNIQLMINSSQAKK